MSAYRDIMEGYFDGRHDERDELPEASNRSRGYVFGWRNGRDDRLKKPRASAEELRAELREIEAAEA